MLNVLLYEFVTGGGLWRDVEPPAESLVREGRAMITALAEDFSACPAVRVAVLRDCRLTGLALPGCDVVEIDSAESELELLAERAAQADWTVVIAPEFHGLLDSRCRLVEAAGGRLLGPAPPLVALASDKHALAEHLHARGLPAPQGRTFEPGERLSWDGAYPAVLKPRDGAGSLGIRHIDSAAALPGTVEMAVRLERFCPGMAASVAVLCGPGDCVPLVPCRQELSEDGRFRYLGGSLPLEPSLAARASRLAVAAVESLAGRLGYLGVDLVLGADDSGRDDYVIEVNPRLTTSYVGLRRAARANLAAAMLEIAAGRRAELSFRPEAISFSADGGCRWNADWKLKRRV